MLLIYVVSLGHRLLGRFVGVIGSETKYWPTNHADSTTEVMKVNPMNGAAQEGSTPAC
jgi:hypothetical protein